MATEQNSAPGVVDDFKVDLGCAEPSPCTYDPKNKGAKSPHFHETDQAERFTGPLSGILDSIADHIGFTPLVHCSRLAKNSGIECELLAKCEFFNAGGSVKDRIGRRMILDAEKDGRIKPGDTLIEPTSGNTGIGLALNAALRGYKMIITLPEKMSGEKVNVLKGLGAEIIRTPTEAAFDSPNSHIGVAQKLSRDLGDTAHVLDQYSNPSNPIAHYDGTAEELIVQCGGKIDYIIATAGTGGTISGIAAKIKEKMPECKIIGVDPWGSILARPEKLNEGWPGGSYHVEGIGYDFIPKVLNHKNIDEWVKTEDQESFDMARRMIKEEALLCGGSCGCAMAAAVAYIKKHNIGKGKRVVVICPDSVRNYMTKFLCDDWMMDNGFLERGKCVKETAQKAPWASKTVADLKPAAPTTVVPSVTVKQAVEIMGKERVDQLPVVENGEILGVVTQSKLMKQLMSANNPLRADSPVTDAMIKKNKFTKFHLCVPPTMTLGVLSTLFETRDYAMVVNQTKSHSADGAATVKEGISGIITRSDFLAYTLS